MKNGDNGMVTEPQLNIQLPEMEFEEEDLEKRVKRAERLIRVIDELKGGSGDLVLYGVSRHLVARNRDGTFVGKSYLSMDHWKSEQENLRIFGEINHTRTASFRRTTDSDLPYLGLPDIGMSFENEDFPPFYITPAVRGTLLHDKIRDGTATLEHFALAIVQLARIMQEGKNNSDRLRLVDIVRDRDYFMERFDQVFLGRLINYGHDAGLKISEQHQEEMRAHWRTLVAQPLHYAHSKGHYGFYSDGQPRHHIISPDGKFSVILDHEYKILTPTLLGVASLLFPGTTRKDGSQYLTPDEQQYLLDRFLLELEFVESLKPRERTEERARRIHRYVAEAYASRNYDLADVDLNQFLRFLNGRDDEGIGRNYRRDFLRGWLPAVLDRSSAWVGHNARYRKIVQDMGRLDVNFEEEEPERQYAREQRQHMMDMLNTLERMKEMLPANAGNGAYSAIVGLRGRLTDILEINHNYFNPR